MHTLVDADAFSKFCRTFSLNSVASEGTPISYQRELGAITGPVFAALNAKDGMMDRHLFDKWLMVAETTAKLRKLDASMWHAYRRKWATERKHLNPKDVAAASGWKDIATLLEGYQQSDEASVLAVKSEPRKLHERGVA